ncbi:MAG: GNAT family N-acetyltransferase [Solirubrobacterales bacterium]
MDAKLVPLADLEDRDLAAWRELADRAVEPNPFFDPDFVLPAARGLDEWENVAILRVTAGADWAACLPVRRYSRWHGLPLPSVATWMHPYCFLGTPLVGPDHPHTSLMAAIDEMRTKSGPLSFTALEWTPAEGSVAEALRYPAPARTVSFSEFTRPTLVRRPQCDYLEGRVKSKHRSEFRRLARKLEKDVDAPLEIVELSSEPGAIDAFLELEAAGWKGEQGTALAANPEHSQFFREMTRAFATRDALQLLFLQAGGQKIAAQCNLLAGGGVFGFKLAHDEDFKRYAPGRELHLRAIERFHGERRLDWIDSCASPRCELLDQLFPNHRTLVTSVYPTGPLSRAAASGLRGSQALRGRLRARVA